MFIYDSMSYFVTVRRWENLNGSNLCHLPPATHRTMIVNKIQHLET